MVVERKPPIIAMYLAKTVTPLLPPHPISPHNRPTFHALVGVAVALVIAIGRDACVGVELADHCGAVIGGGRATGPQVVQVRLVEGTTALAGVAGGGCGRHADVQPVDAAFK